MVTEQNTTQECPTSQGLGIANLDDSIFAGGGKDFAIRREADRSNPGLASEAPALLRLVNRNHFTKSLSGTDGNQVCRSRPSPVEHLAADGPLAFFSPSSHIPFLEHTRYIVGHRALAVGQKVASEPRRGGMGDKVCHHPLALDV